MNYIIDHDYHIHSQLSIDIAEGMGYGNDEILRYAEDNGLTGICVTNHFWDETVPCDFYWYQAQGYEHLKEALPLPQRDNVGFFFGCEADMDMNFNLGITKQTAEKFDFIIVATTHMHMTDFAVDAADDDIDYRRELYIRRLKKLISSDLPFHKVGVAHLTTPLICPKVEDGHVKVLSGISNDEFKDIFSSLAKLGAGVELNVKAFRCGEGCMDEILRPYRIAADCGCKFYLGSDSHFPKDLATSKAGFAKILSMLCLEEEQKFKFQKTQK